MKRGIIFILAISLTVMMVGLSTPILSRSVSESHLSRKYIASTQAFWLAEAGLQRGCYELNNGGDTCVGWTDDNGDKTKTESLGSTGDYTVEIYNPLSDNPTITAVGYAPDISSSSRMEKIIDAVLGIVGVPPFKYAAFGKTYLSMQGSPVTDSYDSCIGAYGGGNLGSNGAIGTNGNYDGAITLGGHAIVNGDASTGSGGSVVIGPSATLNGSTDDQANENLPSVKVPQDLKTLSSSGGYTSIGNPVISGGDYKYSSFSVSNNEILTIDGDVRLYLTETSTNALTVSGNAQIVISSGASLTIYTDGPCYFAGNGVVNESYLPEKFKVLSTYSGPGTGLTIIGDNDTYGGFYAPDAEVELSGNGDLYGSLIGDVVLIKGDGNIHYDECLGQTTQIPGVGDYVVQSWQDKSNPYPIVTP